jgi:exodeoxyribonuclease-1
MLESTAKLFDPFNRYSEMKMNFVFYDLETSGLSSGYDQVLQFAAIVVDENFVELERVDIRCRLSLHILPSPMALAITGVAPSDLIDQTLPSEFEFAQKIREFVNKWAPATWTGYNSIGFDEEHLRQMFFQTLQPNVYETQFNGNNRLDILMIVQACRVKHPEALTWVTNQKGKISFKLDQIAPGNGFENHNAHDALGDVEATIFIAQRIAKNAPEFWQAAVENRDKNTLQNKVESFDPIISIQNFYGNLKEYSLCYCGLVQGKGIFFDIAANDPSDYIEASDEDIMTLINQRERVIHKIALNKAPSLYVDGSADGTLRDRANVLKNAHGFRGRLCSVVQQDIDEMELDDDRGVEDRIYEGFYDRSDKSLLDKFQKVDWTERREILSQLSDLRLKQLGRRLLVFQGDVAVSDNDKAKATEYLKKKWFAKGDVKWGTFAKVDEDLRKIKQSNLLDPEKFRDLELYYFEIRRKLELGELIV